jgi:hypothetical protein
MRALTVHDVMPLPIYERSRDLRREAIIAFKRKRRIALGDQITLVFENRDTLLFQIQEMIRAESIVDAKRIQDEIETYSELLPSTGELSATFFIEVTDASKVKDVLDRLQGIDRGQTVWMRVGAHLIYGTFEAGHSKEDKISAVHFVRFRMPERMMEEMRDLHTRMVLGISHPNYHATVAVPDAMRFSLLIDLEAE